jgi:hypothetical protein
MDQINFDQYFLVLILVVIGFLSHQALLSHALLSPGPFVVGPLRHQALLSRAICRGPFVEAHLSQAFLSRPLCRRFVKIVSPRTKQAYVNAML